ncbi:hypothetical protein EWM64_g1209 [Hericium alpestre]|uniref:Cytochrome P450 n=1 Tax=Hericium alpestre TaxID=135208 RepID=A0A4Z0A926_9AGAM|nr:hypothetical protein EWM64_g1209 [Hericium alpestre]
MVNIVPFEADGTAQHSLATELLGTNEAGIAQTDEAIRDVAGAVYSAGGETVTAGLHFAILSLVLHPEVQKRAQAEIDRIVGRERLPDFSDQSSLPYVGAVFREIMRWKTAVPLGLPHAVTQDDEYEGYHIPRGASLISVFNDHFPNRAMLHDPEKYPDPHAFKPERFLREDGTLNNDDVQIAFGFGRRICPGIHIARSSLWIMIASLLATFRIEPAKDAAGREIPINEDRVEGIVSTPVGFECSIVPRDAKARALLDSLA